MGVMDEWSPATFRKFGGVEYRLWGNADDREEAEEDIAVDIRKEGYAVKVTGDRYDGANIWIKPKGGSARSMKGSPNFDI